MNKEKPRVNDWQKLAKQGVRKMTPLEQAKYFVQYKNCKCIDDCSDCFLNNSSNCTAHGFDQYTLIYLSRFIERNEKHKEQKMKDYESRFSIKMLFPDGALVRVKDKHWHSGVEPEFRRYAFTLVGVTTKNYCYLTSSASTTKYDEANVAPWDYVELVDQPKMAIPEYTMEDLEKILGHNFKIKKA